MLLRRFFAIFGFICIIACFCGLSDGVALSGVYRSEASRRQEGHKKHHRFHKQKRSADVMSDESDPKMKKEHPPDIYYLHVVSDIRSRFATTLVTAKLANPAKVAQEATFDVVLPNAAFISNFSMEIGQDIIVGEVKEKEEAKQEYEAAKSAGQSAGHVAQKPRETNRFQISVNVAAESKVFFNLTYQELLKRVHGVYKHVINIQPGQRVEDLKADVYITEKTKITKIRVPSFGEKMGEKTNKDLMKLKTAEDVKVNSAATKDYSTVHVTYQPTAAKLKASEDGLIGQLVVLYDVERSTNGGEIQVVNGYFVHFFAPSGIPTGNKHVVFVLDRSGSMTGKKLKQTKEAMRTILKDLDVGDYFNILLFANNIKKWDDKSVAATPENVNRAIDYVNGINANGGTDIDKALRNGIMLLNNTQTSALTSIIIFLTDGQPTVGVVNRRDILRNVKRLNTDSISIHSIAFGNNADYNLVKKISRQNRGLARKVYEDSDASLQLEGFYAEVSSPLLTKVNIRYLNETADVTSLIQDGSYNYYDGSEYVIAGKLANDDISDITAEVKGYSRAGPERYTVICPIPWPGRPDTIIIPPTHKPHVPLPPDSFGGFVERMWAYLTIKKLLDDSKYMYDDKDKIKSLKQKALDLSLKYNFVSELTSMVVTMPDGQNKTRVKESGADSSANIADLGFQRLSSYHGSAMWGGGVQPSMRYSHSNRLHGLPGPPGHLPLPRLPATTAHEASEAPTTPDTTTSYFNIRKELEDKTIVEGEVQDLMLKCEFDSSHVLKFSWLKDDESVQEEPGRIVISNTDEVTILHLRDPKVSDSGTYRCEAEALNSIRISSDAVITITASNPSTTAMPGSLTNRNDISSRSRSRRKRSHIINTCPEDGCPRGCHRGVDRKGCNVCSCGPQLTSFDCPTSPPCSPGCKLMKDERGCKSVCICKRTSRKELPMTFIVPVRDSRPLPVHQRHFCLDYDTTDGDAMLIYQNRSEGIRLVADIKSVYTDHYQLPLIRSLVLHTKDRAAQTVGGSAARNGFLNIGRKLDLYLKRVKYTKTCPCDFGNSLPYWKIRHWGLTLSQLTHLIENDNLQDAGLLGRIAYFWKNARITFEDQDDPHPSESLISLPNPDSTRRFVKPAPSYVFDMERNLSCWRIGPEFLQ